MGHAGTAVRGRIRALAVAAMVALTAATAGCATGAREPAGVVVTTNILGDVTRNIAGGAVEVTVLMKPNADPHSFGISAREAAAMEEAGLVVYNGLGLEEGILRNVAAAEDAGVPVLEVAALVDPITYRAEDGVSDEAGEADPHFWTDPRRTALAVTAIADRLAEIDGVDEPTVRANAAAYQTELEELDTWMAERLDTIPPERRNLVTNHHVFGYFAQRYDFTVTGAVIPSGTTLASPSASDLESLAEAVRAAGVPAVFADSSQPDRLAQALAEEAGLEVEVLTLYSESLSEEGEGAATYVEMMRANTEAMVDGLGGG